MFFDLKFKNIKNQKIILLVLLGFFLSVLVSINYVSKFDNYEISSDDFENHSMVKSDLLKFWIDAEKINNQIKEGKTYFETGSEYRTPYLPSRTILLFYKITGYDLYDLEKKVKSDNGKLLFFIFQALLYYFSLIYFSKILSNKYSKTACLFIIIFLAFEPTLLLYHSSFWSEYFMVAYLDLVAEFQDLAFAAAAASRASLSFLRLSIASSWALCCSSSRSNFLYLLILLVTLL